jgi:phage-related protein
MRRISFVNALNQQIDFDNDPFLIETLDGLSAADNQIQEQRSPNQDGSTYIDTLYSPRTITLTGSINRPGDIGEINNQKRDMTTLLTAKHGPGTLYYYSDNAEYCIGAIPVSSPLFRNKDAREPFQPFQVQFYCPDPYWKQTSDNIESIETLDPLTEFPIEFTTGGIELSSYLVGSAVNMQNLGDYETPIIVTFYGPATDPKIENQTTGEYIQINKVFASDESMIIDTSFGNKTVRLFDGGVESNGIQYLDLASTFWSLAVGDNQVRFTDDTSSTSARAEVRWRYRYVGV